MGNLDLSLLNFVIAVVLVVVGWFLKVWSDSWSQRTLFDHRLRLEKEYGLYTDLWDKLFELRRAVAQSVESLGDTGAVRHDEQFIERFNAYQTCVRKGEPFMCLSVYEPAREIATLARTIIGNIGKRQSIQEERQREHLSHGADEGKANQLIRLSEENDAAFKNIEQLFQKILGAIRLRTNPQR